MRRRPAIFLDRDGTLIEEQHYPRDAERVRLFADTVPALRELAGKGYLLFVVSNQSGVGRGIIRLDEFWAVHRRCAELLRAEGIRIEWWAYCLHAPDAGCHCRKPRAGLVLDRLGPEEVDLARSHVVGDRRADLELASAIGAKGWLVLTGHGETTRAELGDSAAVERVATLGGFAEAVPPVDSPSPEQRRPGAREAVASV